MQLMPGTAAGLGVTDPFDPQQAIDGAAQYLSTNLSAFGGSLTKALAAYNAGPGAVRQYDGVPPYAETQNYVRKVTDMLARLS
jgi:soluble lytic murein transglycosylase-like protein